MEQSKGVNALSYLSAFFAPFIVPIIIYFASKDVEIRHHAKRALISHIVPLVIGIILFIAFFFTVGNADSAAIGFGYIVAFVGYMLLVFAFSIWNVVQAIKVLR